MAKHIDRIQTADLFIAEMAISSVRQSLVSHPSVGSAMIFDMVSPASWQATKASRKRRPFESIRRLGQNST
jgi:hypothetical protein